MMTSMMRAPAKVAGLVLGLLEAGRAPASKKRKKSTARKRRLKEPKRKVTFATLLTTLTTGAISSVHASNPAVKVKRRR